MSNNFAANNKKPIYNPFRPNKEIDNSQNYLVREKENLST